MLTSRFLSLQPQLPTPPVVFPGGCSPAVSGTWPGGHCSAPEDRAKGTGQGGAVGEPLPPGVHSPAGAHLAPVLGQVRPDGLDLVVEDIVLLHLLVHQQQVRPEALAAQLILGGGGQRDSGDQGGWDSAHPVTPERRRERLSPPPSHLSCHHV